LKEEVEPGAIERPGRLTDVRIDDDDYCSTIEFEKRDIANLAQ
jgi:hypothetical protein